MSVRECAIIQTFPDDFIFTGSLGNMYKQIGNGVPVLLGKKIAERIKEVLDNYEFNRKSTSRIEETRRVRVQVS
jgi:DNA (cytosine-5)-methyltransferase 1